MPILAPEANDAASNRLPIDAAVQPAGFPAPEAEMVSVAPEPTETEP